MTEALTEFKPPFKNNYEESGWSLMHHNNLSVVSKINRIDLLQVAGPSEEYVTWSEMLQRARKHGAALNQIAAESLLDQADHIPSEWQDYSLVFPGTIWRSRNDQLHCPSLAYSDNSWGLRLHWLLFDFHHETRFLTSEPKN